MPINANIVLHRPNAMRTAPTPMHIHDIHLRQEVFCGMNTSSLLMFLRSTWSFHSAKSASPSQRYKVTHMGMNMVSREKMLSASKAISYLYQSAIVGIKNATKTAVKAATTVSIRDKNSDLSLFHISTSSFL